MRRLLLLLLIGFIAYQMSQGGGGGGRDGDPPIPGVADLHVLVVEETQDRHELTQEQMAVLTGEDVRDWLEANTADEDGGSKAYRFWDQDQLGKLENESTKWQVIGEYAKKAETPEPPWILVADGSASRIAPLPDSPAETIDFLDDWSR